MPVSVFHTAMPPRSDAMPLVFIREDKKGASRIDFSIGPGLFFHIGTNHGAHQNAFDWCLDMQRGVSLPRKWTYRAQSRIRRILKTAAKVFLPGGEGTFVAFFVYHCRTLEKGGGCVATHDKWVYGDKASIMLDRSRFMGQINRYKLCGGHLTAYFSDSGPAMHLIHIRACKGCPLVS